MTTRVTSRQNPRLKEVARLIASSRDRRKSGLCVLEGEHAITVYLDRVGAPETLVVVEASHYGSSLEALVARVPPAHTLTVPRGIFAEWASLSADVGVLAVVPTPVPAPAPPADFCLLLEDIQDPGNVGSMLRSAAAAGVVQVYLSPGCAFAWSPKVLRAAQGAHFQLTIREDADLAAWAHDYRATGGSVVAAVATGGSRWYGEPFPARVALAIGNEGAGLSAALLAAADRRVTITMPGGTESLNAAVAAGILMFERVRQRR
jgi:TrmH family RNA methyltransferase